MTVISDNGPVPSTTFSELLQRTFQIYRNNFVTLISIMAIGLVPLVLIGLPFLPPPAGLTSAQRVASAATLLQTCFVPLIRFVLSILQTVYTTGPLVYATSEILRGNPVTVREAFTARKDRYVALGIGNVVVILIIVIPILIFGLGATMLSCAPILAGLGLGIFVVVATGAMLTPVFILEETGIWAGIKRAWALGKARFWTVFGVISVFGIIGAVINVLFRSITLALVLPGSRGVDSYMTVTIVSAIVAMIVSIFTGPFAAVAQTLLYVDVRARFERQEPASSAASDVLPVPSWNDAPSVSAGLNSKDWANIAILCVATGVFVLVLGGAAVAFLRSLSPMG